MPIHDHHQMHAYASRREMGEILVSMAIRQMALSMYAIFEPIYLFQALGSIPQTLIFYAIVTAAYALFIPLGMRIVSRIGVKHSMLIASPFLFLYIVGLSMLPTAGTWFIVPLGLVSTFYKLFFWPAFHIDFAKFDTPGKLGSQTGMLQFIMYLSGTAGPVLGGLIIAFGGYPTLFIVVLAILMASVIPLFLSREVHEIYSLGYRETMRNIFRRSNARSLVAFGAQGGENKIGAIVWPLFLALVIGEAVTIGSLTSAVLLIAAAFSLIIGRLSDKWSRRRMLRVGALLNAAAWTLRSFIQTNLQVFAFDTVGRVSQRSAYIPFLSIFYDTAQKKGKDVDEFVAFRELSHQIGVIVVLLLAAALYLLTGSLIPAFILAAVMSAIFILLKP